MDFYQYGYDLFASEKGNNWPGWHKMPEGYRWEGKGGLPRDYYDFYRQARDGYENAKKDYLKPHVVPAIHSLIELKNKYNIQIETGCGCCGGGYYIDVDGLTFEFDIEDFV